jgi:uncharacterized membrane protein YtjA (UPF0391 family)
VRIRQWILWFEGLTFEEYMLRWALIFLVVAIIAEFFGFSGAAGEAVWIAHVLFVVALIFLIISFVTGRRGPPAI